MEIVDALISMRPSLELQRAALDEIGRLRDQNIQLQHALDAANQVVSDLRTRLQAEIENRKQEESTEDSRDPGSAEPFHTTEVYP